MKELYVRSYLGIGDNIYQRPFIKKLAAEHDHIYLNTPVPQVYVDCGYNIKFVKPDLGFKGKELRTHKIARDSMPEVIWTPEPPASVEVLALMYHQRNNKGASTKLGDSIIECFDRQAPGANFPDDFKIDVRDQWKEEAKIILESHPNYIKGKPICIIKPPTVRDEWAVPSRNPKWEYYLHLMYKYKNDYQFVSVADLEDEKEWLDTGGGPYVSDCVFHKGEFNIMQMFGLVSIADITVCSVSFMLPLCAAADAKCLCLFGGFMAPQTVIDERMGLDNLAYAAPEKYCKQLDSGLDIGCFNPNCGKCDKDLDIDKLESSFEDLINDKKTTKKHVTENRRRNLMLVRIIPERMDKIAKNEFIREDYDIHILSKDIDNIIDESLFKSITRLEGPRGIVEQLLYNKKIDTAIISQQLFPLSELVAKACKEADVPVIWTERFFDNKMIFDKIGLQYMPENEIDRYLSKVHYTGSPDIPESTREKQADNLSKEDLYKKYRLDEHKKYIVMFGQTTFDMSMTKWKSRRIRDFKEYAELLIMSNPDVTFIFKNHPLYYNAYAYRKNKDVGFMATFENVIEVMESIDTLFNSFELFTSFSSTTILEGLIWGKKFATAGYHFCDDPAVVLQLKTTDMAVNLWERLSSFKINKETLWMYTEFICNYLCLDVQSEDLLKKIELSPDRFYKYMSEKYEG